MIFIFYSFSCYDFVENVGSLHSPSASPYVPLHLHYYYSWCTSKRSSRVSKASLQRKVYFYKVFERNTQKGTSASHFYKQTRETFALLHTHQPSHVRQEVKRKILLLLLWLLRLWLLSSLILNKYTAHTQQQQDCVPFPCSALAVFRVFFLMYRHLMNNMPLCFPPSFLLLSTKQRLLRKCKKVKKSSFHFRHNHHQHLPVK